MGVLKPLLHKPLPKGNNAVHVEEAVITTKRAADEFRKIALPTLEGIHFEKVNNIISLEAKGNYTTIRFINSRQMLISKTLQEVEKQLRGNDQFIRIHRSFTINMNHLLRYNKGKGGFVELESGIRLNVSSSRKAAFVEAIHQYFGCLF